MQPYKIATFLFALLISTLYGCYVEEPIPGPPGPPGLDGFDGRDGHDGQDGQNAPLALEYEIVFDLNADNEWQAYFEYPAGDVVLPQDVVLVYLLWGQEEPEDGGDLIDVWRAMPVSYFYDEGLLQLNYDFTAGDMKIFAEAAFSLEAERDVFEEFVARIVVVPAEFSTNARLNPETFQDYQSARQWLKLPHIRRTQGTPFLEAVQQRK